MNKFKAGIFDLDGVITETATTHAKAWKKMFDAYNQRRQIEGKDTYTEFSIEKDYPQYLDGMPRYDGVQNFLRSRNIELPWGSDDDAPGKETICGIGNWKNQIFHEIIEEEGADTIEPNVEQIRQWKAAGLRIAVISSSKNCKKILEVAGLKDLFEVRIDGVVSRERNLTGKPAPDIFLEAANDLTVDPSEAFIVEDSRAGVEAGKKGGFKLVVGIGDEARKNGLFEHGADVVVKSLQELEIEIG